MQTYCSCRLGNLSQVAELHFKFMYSIVQWLDDHLILSLDTGKFTSQLAHFPPQPLDQLISVYNNNSSTKTTMIMCCHGAVIMASHCQSSCDPSDEYTLNSRCPPILKASQLTRAMNMLIGVGCYYPHPPLPFIIITQPKSRYLFYYPELT